MANVLNRFTKIYLTSVNTPEYPIDNWIINPDLSSVSRVPVKYWKIVGDTVSEMNQTEKDDVDQNIRVVKQEDSIRQAVTSFTNAERTKLLIELIIDAIQIDPGLAKRLGINFDGDEPLKS